MYNREDRVFYREEGDEVSVMCSGCFSCNPVGYFEVNQSKQIGSECADKCGTEAKVTIVSQPCNEALINLVEVPVKNLSGCSIFSSFPNDLGSMKESITFLLTEITERFNGNLTFSNNVSFKYYDNIRVGIHFDAVKPNLDTSKVIYRQDWLWITAAPTRVFPLETISTLLQFEVWILTGIVFVFTVIVWWLTVKLRTLRDKSVQGKDAFINITSLTLCGTTTSAPKMNKLGYVFVIYSLYASLMQTAFKTNLIYVLTLPRYNTEISTAKEIIDLKLPVCVLPVINNRFSKNNGSDENEYDKLMKLLISKELHKCIKWIYDYRNVTVLTPEVTLLGMAPHTKRNLNIFIDNRVTGIFKLEFAMKKGHHFMENLNQIITILDESGISQKKIQSFHHNSKEKTTQETLVPLNLEQLHSVFLLLVIGLVLSFVVFTIEIVYSKYKNKINWCTK
ncbi:hypothetical protein FQA39_LY08130 [Lamprigera yunnana]|nr:hypothetical protein FQA39_LY08130 [Lamprigera yunnana]